MSDPVSPVSGSSYFGDTAAKPTSTLDMSTFLNLLVTQLKNQDPTSPMDDASFYAQIAQLGQVQGMQKLNASADLQQAQSLLGKTVTATRPTSSNSSQSSVFTGVVQSITFKSGQQYMNVQEEGSDGTVQIQIGAIQSVVPTVDVASYSSLIGKRAAGTSAGTAGTADAAGTTVTGVILGITAVNGVAMAQIQPNGTTARTAITAVPVSSLSMIASS